MKKLFTLIVSFLFFTNLYSQGTETFTNMPASVSSYATRNWTGDGGITWTCTDARTDQTITSRAIGMRASTLTSGTIVNGIGNLSFNYKYIFTGSAASLSVKVNGTVVGTVAVPTTQTATTNASFPNLNISGNVIIEIAQTVGTQRVAVDDITWTANAVACTEPTTQPTGPITFTASATSISGSFTAAVPAPDQYLIVRSTSPTLSATPTDGVDYVNGAALGGGVVVASTSLTSFTDNGLTPNTNPYYYFIFAVNNDACGSNYLTTAPLTGSQATPPTPICTTPAAAPSPITLTPTNTSITGNFTAVSDANRYLVIISTSPTLSASPINGTTYTIGQNFGGGKIVSFGSATSFTATGLTPNTIYYVFVFAANADCTGTPFYSTTSSVANTTTTNVTTGIPTGYYNAATGLTCQPLKTALRNIAASANVISYTPGLWNLYQYSDQHRNDANTADIMWDMYSDNPTGPEPYTFTYSTNQCGTYSTEGNCYNREHTTPQSWFNQLSPMVSDAHHIFPTDGKVNGVRSNFPYGEVISATSTSLNGSKLGTGNNFGYTATVFEPINEYKGDFARAGLYMAVRYENEIISQNWSGFGNANEVFLNTIDQPNAATRKLEIYDDWYLKLLYKWHVQDPVSQKEIDRNNVIYSQSVANNNASTSFVTQANRNPFIDHPEYALAIWGNDCLPGVIPVDFVDVQATLNKNEIIINWKIENEINIYDYEVLKSEDGIHFTSIGSISSINVNDYSFTDKNITGNNIAYYRIKAKEMNGRFNLSKIVQVKIFNSNGLLIYPNPATNIVNIKWKKNLNTAATIIISDLMGRVVKTEKIFANQNSISIPTNTFNAGKYFIKIIDGSNIINESFIKIK